MARSAWHTLSQQALEWGTGNCEMQKACEEFASTSFVDTEQTCDAFISLLGKLKKLLATGHRFAIIWQSNGNLKLDKTFRLLAEYCCLPVYFPEDKQAFDELRCK